MDILDEMCLMEKYDLTPDELFLLKVVCTEDDELYERYESLHDYQKGDFEEMINAMKSNGILKKDSEDVTLYNLTKRFTRDFYISSLDAGRELYDVYPLSTVVNGMEYKLRRISKKFSSLEEAFDKYGRSINWSPEKHKEVIELVKLGKENDYAFSTLDAFIVDNDWVNIKALLDKNNGNSYYHIKGEEDNMMML